MACGVAAVHRLAELQKEQQLKEEKLRLQEANLKESYTRASAPICMR